MLPLFDCGLYLKGVICLCFAVKLIRLYVFYIFLLIIYSEPYQ